MSESNISGLLSDDVADYIANKSPDYKFLVIGRGVKADADKRRYSLLPTNTMNEVVDVLEYGSKKYSDHNWKFVDDARTRYYDATLRHIDAWWHGQINDDETGKHHLAHAVCCLLFLMWFDLENS